MFAEQILEMPMPKADDKTFAKVLSIKQAVAQSVFTTTARVRDGLLRPASDDGFAKVQEAMRRAQNDDGEPDDPEPDEDVNIFA